MGELPQQVQLQILKDFIYPNFCTKFNRLLRFRNCGHESKVKLKFDDALFSGTEVQNVNLEGLKKEPKKNQNEIDPYRFITQPFYNFNDSEYRSFMLKLMISLETRNFQMNEIIYEELDDALEIHFVMSGTYNVGYIINQQAAYRLQFTDRTIIAGFNMVFDKRIMYRYKA